jgi:hypothetical protein
LAKVLNVGIVSEAGERRARASYFYLDSVIDHTTPLEFVISIVPAPAGNNSVPS